MGSKRLLLVDDEPAIRESLEAVLSATGFEVASAASVSEAIQSISKGQFDIVLTDLHIGQPGDGFTVVSALRRMNPEAISLIMTGYPAFDAALQAIRDQVDDYVVKPIPPSELIQKIKYLIETPRSQKVVHAKRTSEIISAEKQTIVAQLLSILKKKFVDATGTAPPDADILNSLPDLIDELCRQVEERDERVSPKAVDAASAHGRLRFKQGFDIAFVLGESAILRQQILRAVHQNLLVVNISSLFLDIAQMNSSLDAQVQLSVSEYAALALGKSSP
jgi:DNA-binding response OmpR family regulator